MTITQVHEPKPEYHLQIEIRDTDQGTKPEPSKQVFESSDYSYNPSDFNALI